MSKITLEPNSSGAGTFSIVSPDSNTNRTLTLPDEAGTVATIENIPPGYEDQDALDLFNVTGSAPVYACRAWVKFNGFANSIYNSGNVSSVTDEGTGQHIINFSTNMPDNDYTVSGICQGNSTGSANVSLDNGIINPELQANRFAIRIIRPANNSYEDADPITVTVFR